MVTTAWVTEPPRSCRSAREASTAVRAIVTVTATASDSARLARSTASMTALTAVSRITGFIRILVVAAVLGTTFLGNVYQSANTVPNLLFELIAAGVLQAVLIPTLVAQLDRGDQAEAEHVAGSVLGLSLVVLGSLALLGAAAAPFIARGLFSGVHDPAIRHAQIRLGTVFLWLFLPQVAMYAAGMVATSVLNARDRFAIPVVAPALNNVVVTAAYLWFAWLRHGQPPSLHLNPLEVIVLAGGTTFGVVVFCGLPVVAAVRGGFAMRPRFDRRHPEVRRLGRLGAWAALFLAVTQLLLVVVLLLANRVEGGVVAYQVAFTFFLLPHALFALPVLTALFPQMSRQASDRDWGGYAGSIERGVASISYFVLPAAALLIGLAPLIAHAVLFGRTDARGASQVADVLIGFAPGVYGYGIFLFVSRVLYARGDTRSPALVNLGVALGGAVLMVAGFAATDGTQRVAALAGAHSLAYTAGAVVLYRLARRRLPEGSRPRVARLVAPPLAAAAASGGAMWAAAKAYGHHAKAADALAVTAIGTAGGLLYVTLTALLGGPHPRSILALVRGGSRG
ncbi:MAG: putative rane protein putative virulence factor [Acidimicrobiales bacterium]|nr:putative rane protein putative virulence factor [Acidimicrobiales bacterium]